jgi:hypothetical protein
MHALEIQIDEDSVRLSSGSTPIQLSGVGYDFDREFLILHVDKPLAPGQIINISMKFTRYVSFKN